MMEGIDRFIEECEQEAKEMGYETLHDAVVDLRKKQSQVEGV